MAPLPMEVTWRPVTSIPLAETDGNPDTAADRRLAAARQHSVASRISCRAPRPQRRGCDRSPQLLPATTDVYVDDRRSAEPHVHQHPAGTLGRQQRPGLGRHALPEHSRDQRRRRPGDRPLREPEIDAADSHVSLCSEIVRAGVRLIVCGEWSVRKGSETCRPVGFEVPPDLIDHARFDDEGVAFLRVLVRGTARA